MFLLVKFGTIYKMEHKWNTKWNKHLKKYKKNGTMEQMALIY